MEKIRITLIDRFEMTYQEVDEVIRKIREKEKELKENMSVSYGEVKWTIWAVTGHRRAYYWCSWKSKYANAKSCNYIEI